MGGFHLQKVNCPLRMMAVMTSISGKTEEGTWGFNEVLITDARLFSGHLLVVNLSEMSEMSLFMA